MQKALLDLERRQQDRDREAKKELPIAPHKLKDGSSGASIDKMGVMLNESSEIEKQIREESDKISSAESKLEEESSNLVYMVMASTILAIVVGMIVGSCLVLCCLKSYKSNQQKRLSEAGHQNLRFVEGENAVPMATQMEPKVATQGDNNYNTTSGLTNNGQKDDDEEVPDTNRRFNGAEVIESEDIQLDEVKKVKKSGHNKTVAIPDVAMRTLADDDENDFVNVLTQRGIAFDAPNGRRASTKQPPATADKRELKNIKSLDF